MEAKYYSYFLGILDYLIARGLENSGSVSGLSSEEVDAVEKQLNIALPASYRAWLRVFGGKMSTSLLEFYTLTRNDLITATMKFRQVSANEFVDPQSVIAIAFIEHAAAYVILNCTDEDGGVNFFYPVEELEEAEDHFTSCIRETIIRRIKSLNQYNGSFADVKWLNVDYFRSQLNDDRFSRYYAARKQFTEMIERFEAAQGVFVLPDDFQWQWIEFLKQNGMDEFLKLE